MSTLAISSSSPPSSSVSMGSIGFYEILAKNSESDYCQEESLIIRLYLRKPFILVFRLI